MTGWQAGVCDGVSGDALTKAVKFLGWMEPETLERMLIFSRHFALFLTMYSISCTATLIANDVVVIIDPNSPAEASLAHAGVRKMAEAPKMPILTVQGSSLTRRHQCAREANASMLRHYREDEETSRSARIANKTAYKVHPY